MNRHGKQTERLKSFLNAFSLFFFFFFFFCRRTTAWNISYADALKFEKETFVFTFCYDLAICMNAHWSLLLQSLRNFISLRFSAV